MDGKQNQLIHHIDGALKDSPDWILTTTTEGDQKARIWAWAGISFPQWARPGLTKPNAIRLPVIKPLLKSKCFKSGIGKC